MLVRRKKERERVCVTSIVGESAAGAAVALALLEGVADSDVAGRSLGVTSSASSASPAARAVRPASAVPAALVRAAVLVRVAAAVSALALASRVGVARSGRSSGRGLLVGAEASSSLAALVGEPAGGAARALAALEGVARSSTSSAGSSGSISPSLGVVTASSALYVMGKPAAGAAVTLSFLEGVADSSARLPASPISSSSAGLSVGETALISSLAITSLKGITLSTHLNLSHSLTHLPTDLT